MSAGRKKQSLQGWRGARLCQMGESIRIEVLDWYVSQPMFIQRICAQQPNDAGILTEDHMCDKLSMSA